MESRSADVVVVGAGPAGWSLAHACSTRGLDTLVVAPRPEAVWWPTYGLWGDQCPALPEGSRYELAPTVLAAGRRVGRAYAVLDNASVLAAYRSGGVRTMSGTVASASLETSGMAVRLRTGALLTAAVVVDASGDRRVLSGGPAAGPRAEQTAHGVVVPEEVAAPLVRPGEAVFMEWARGGAEGEWPTFLYAVPLPGGGVLLEETSLARRPGLPLDVLAQRLSARLAAADVPVDAVLANEKVRFAVDLPVPSARPGVLAFGVAGGMMHPATGFSVGDSVTTAPAVAEALAAELPRGPVAAASAGRAVVWPAAARAVRRLRDLGLHTLLRLPPAKVPHFFDAFFDLTPDQQRAYLSGRDDLRGTVTAMTGLFGAASWPVRRAMVTSQLRRPGRGEQSDAAEERSPDC